MQLPPHQNSSRQWERPTLIDSHTVHAKVLITHARAHEGHPPKRSRAGKQCVPAPEQSKVPFIRPWRQTINFLLVSEDLSRHDCHLPFVA